MLTYSWKCHKVRYLHCSLWENFTGVTPAVVFDNDVAVIVIKYAAVVIVNDAAVVNVVNAHAVAEFKYSSCKIIILLQL